MMIRVASDEQNLNMKVALTIAGSDSCGGAGIQQDLKVFSAMGVHGTCVITAITAQNTIGVKKSFPLSKEIIEEQIDAIFSDIKIDAVKTGMLGNEEIVSAVCKKIREYKIKNLVVDPVMKSTSRDILLEDNAVASLKKLISLATITKPNRKEAEILTEIKIRTIDDVKKAAMKIGNCVITGGDVGGTDVLYFDGKFHTFESNLKISREIHGTGCAFSAALTAFLAKGFSVPEAVERTKDFMESSISKNFSVGHGLHMADVSGIKLGRTYDGEKNRVVENVANAIEKFCSEKESYLLIPEVGCNIAMALPNAKSVNEIAGLTGRIVKDKIAKRAIPVGFVDFSGSSHVAKIVLAAMKFDKEKRAAMNIWFSEEVLDACKKLKLKIATFDRENEPSNMSTMEWGTKTAIEKFGNVPGIIYDEGGKGKEAMVRILGNDAGDVGGIAERIARELAREYISNSKKINACRPENPKLH